MREAILGVLHSILKSANFEGQRQYIVNDGLKQLSKWCSFRDEQEKEMFGGGAIRYKIKLKLIQLLNELIVNDDSILNDGFTVRKAVI